MPADRFLHPRLGHSHKVTMLTDFEYRVWTQYILSADDFGVMRASGVTLQSANDALGAKPVKTVTRALEHVIASGLLLTFEHQGRRYVYQRDWQDFQKIDYPRPTIEPNLPADALAGCTPATQKLFTKHPGGNTRRKADPSPTDSGDVLRKFPESSATPSGKFSDEIPTTRARACEEAKATAKATAKADAPATSLEGPEIAARGAQLVERFGELYSEHRHGARHRMRPSLDWKDACDLCRVWPDDARLEKLIVIFLTTDEPWIASTDRSFQIFAKKATWADERLAAWEAERAKKAATA